MKGKIENMSTKTKTDSKAETKEKPQIAASTKVVAAVVAWSQASTQAEASYITLFKTVKSEKERNKYDEGQTRAMVVASYREAFGVDAKNADTVKTFDTSRLGDYSRIMRLVFPKDAKAAAEVQKAIDHNDKHGNTGNRIGVLKIVDMARKKTTFTEVINHKRRVKDASKAQKSVYTRERFKLDLSGVLSKGHKAKISIDNMEDDVAELIAEYREEEEEAAEKATAQKKAA